MAASSQSRLVFLQPPAKRNKQLPGVPVNAIAEGTQADEWLAGCANIPDEFGSDCIVMRASWRIGKRCSGISGYSPD
jgi:hypothetical protein